MWGDTFFIISSYKKIMRTKKKKKMLLTIRDVCVSNGIIGRKIINSFLELSDHFLKDFFIILELKMKIDINKVIYFSKRKKTMYIVSVMVVVEKKLKC